MALQDGPIEDGHDDASEVQRLAGLVTQVRADHLLGTTQDAERLLRERLEQTGIQVSEQAFQDLLARVTA